MGRSPESASPRSTVRVVTPSASTSSRDAESRSGHAPDLVVGGQHLGDAVSNASGRPVMRTLSPLSMNRIRDHLDQWASNSPRRDTFIARLAEVSTLKSQGLRSSWCCLAGSGPGRGSEQRLTYDSKVSEPIGESTVSGPEGGGESGDDGGPDELPADDLTGPLRNSGTTLEKATLRASTSWSTHCVWSR